MVVQAVTECAKAPATRVLFLRGEKLSRDPILQRLMSAADWPFQICSVTTRDEWRRRGFSYQVDQVDSLLDSFPIAVAHGYDAWVLMAAAEQRTARAEPAPFLLLLNPVLGESRHLNGSLVGYRAPRSPRVRTAFGLDPEAEGVRSLTGRVTYVFGDNDRYSSQRDWSFLRGLGCRVHTIRGWHPRHRREIEEQLADIISGYSHALSEALGAAGATPRADELCRAAVS